MVTHAIEGIGGVADVVDEKDAVEMVDFVHKGAGEKTTSFEANFGAIGKKSFDFDFFRAFNEPVDLWYRETTFLFLDKLAAGADNFWIDESGERLVLFVVKVVAHNDNALILTHLGSGHGGGDFIGVFFFPREGGSNHISN